MADEAHPIEENENSSTTPNPLQGLADDLEDVAAIRKYCLKNKALLSWLSPQSWSCLQQVSEDECPCPGDRFAEVVPGGPRSENCSRELLEKNRQGATIIATIMQCSKTFFLGDLL